MPNPFKMTKEERLARSAELRDKVAGLRAQKAEVTAPTSFEGVAITDGRVAYKGQTVALAGVTASVETAGQIERRVTVTRLATIGFWALLAKKRKDNRELYLLVDGADGAFVASVNPKQGEKARAFAARLNTLGKRNAQDRTGMIVSTRVEETRQDRDEFYTTGYVLRMDAPVPLSALDDDTLAEAVDSVRLPVAEDPEEWERLADAELAASGYRRIGEWQGDGTTLYAAIEWTGLIGLPGR